MVNVAKIYFEPNDMKTSIPQDIPIVEAFNRYTLLDKTLPDPNDNTASMPWLLRLSIDRQKMAELDLTMLDLKVALDILLRNQSHP